MNYKKINNLRIVIPIILFSVISIITIYSSQTMLSSSFNDLYIKQIIWYLIGFILVIFISRKNNQTNDNLINILYIIGNILLILVLFFGTEANGSRCWFTIPGIGSFQPSEFMKIFLILMIAKELEKSCKKNYQRTLRDEFKVIFKCFILTLIPTILTFLEPDTGIVFIYFIILLIMLFIFGIRYRWFFIGIIFMAIVLFAFFYLFFKLFRNN